jgi:serine/threonine protein kinase
MPELPLVGEEFAGHRLISVLGRGGMSIVFRAENPRLGNVIALKVLDPSLADDDVFRTRFLEESRIAAAMNHPNVIPIHDMGSSGGLLYIAMRYVTGTDMRQMLKKRGRLQPETAIHLLSQAARALDAAHRRGLVHRDVKPGNLLVERANDDTDPDHVYLADFGITKHQGGRTGLTSTGAFLGTLDYVAPEQIRGISVLGLADQYSLGCVLYECLTGRVPFEKDLDAAIIWAHMEESPTQPTVLRPDLPPAVDEVFARVLAKNPGERYETCRDFIAAARDALGPLAGPATASGAAQAFLPGSGQHVAPHLPPRSAPPGSAPPWPPVPQPASPWPSVQQPAAPWPPAAEPAQPAGYPLEYQAAPPAEVPRVRTEAAPAHAPTEQIPGAMTIPPSGAVPVARPLPPPPPPGGQGGGSRPHRRSRRGRAWWVVAAALLVIAGAATGITLGLTGGKGTPQAAGSRPAAGTSTGPNAVSSTSTGTASTGTASAMASPTASASMPMTTAPAAANESPRTADCSPGGRVAVAAKNMGMSGPASLAGVLQEANLCSTPAGDLPPAKCQSQGAAVISCTAPAPGVARVWFYTYPALSTLYTQYLNQVATLAGSYQQNTRTHCGNTIGSYAETGWNHLELHPTQFTYQQMEVPGFNQVQAMGRQACFMSGGKPYLVWTTDVGGMLAVAQGTGSMSALYNWWAQIHHVIIFRGTVMCGQNMGRMNSVPQGNLKSAMVCPTGSAPGGGMPSATASMSGM